MHNVLAGFSLILMASSLAAAEPVAGQITSGHSFACADYTQGKIFLVSKSGRVEWEYPARSCDDLWVLPNGNVLFVTGHGVKEVTRDKQVIFSYASKSEIYACQRLPNGNTFVGECNAGRLLEVTPNGEIAKEIRLLPAGTDGVTCSCETRAHSRTTGTSLRITLLKSCGNMTQVET